MHSITCSSVISGIDVDGTNLAKANICKSASLKDASYEIWHSRVLSPILCFACFCSYSFLSLSNFIRFSAETPVNLDPLACALNVCLHPQPEHSGCVMGTFPLFIPVDDRIPVTSVDTSDIAILWSNETSLVLSFPYHNKAWMVGMDHRGARVFQHISGCPP